MTAALIERLQVALGDRYAINRPLGEGGMGVVFHATDVKHDRPVAIKVLRTDTAESLGAERFLREIRITAKLDHPNILMLIDSGEADGLLYYVMPFVDGESLRDRLIRECPLPTGEALRIAVQVADALAYAHKQGVVHRDVKPENILLSGAHAKLADFGIARAPKSTEQTTAALTQVGMALGTPAYMSPEQFFGDAGVDHRSDLYALACVVYEMLTGAPPFAGEAVTKRLVADAPRLTTTGLRVPPMVDLVVARALARDAAERHASMDEFAAALQTEISGPVPLRTDGAVSAPSPRALFVGRERELAEGRDLLAGLADGRGGVLLLGGEPGVGKTRLANALLDEARRLQALCLVGHCYEMEGMPPYTPFAEVLEYVSRLVPPATFRETLGDAASEVARVQPLLRQLFTDIPEPVDLPPDRQRANLHAQYRAFNERATRVAPIVLLLDDLHWADEPSLALLANMATYLGRVPIVVIGTYRDTDLDTERPFATALETLTRQRLARRLAVRRLPMEGTAALLEALGGSSPPETLVQTLHAETDGNPFFVEEVFQHLREEGRLFDATGAWISGLDTDTLDVPEGVRLVVGRRFKRLSDACQSTLQSAAVIAPRFELPTLLALGEHDEDTLLDALDEAVAAHLVIEERGARVATYRFAHELIRQTLLAPLSLPRRQRRHLKVAQALESSLGAKAGLRAADIAFHFFQAGAAADEAVTVGWLVRAAEQALASGAYAETVAQCERALSVSDERSAEDDARLHDCYGQAQRGLARWDAALSALLVANRRYGETGAHSARAVVLQHVNAVMLWAGKHHECIPVLDGALNDLPPTPIAERAILLSLKIRTVAQAGWSFEQCRVLMEQANAEVRLTNDARAREAVAVMLPNYCQVFALHNDLLAAVDTVVPMLQEPRARQSLCEMLGIRLYAWRFTGQYETAHAESRRVRAISEESGHVGGMLYADILPGCSRVLEGDLDGYLRWAHDTLETWASGGPWRLLNQTVVIELLAWRGRGEEATRHGLQYQTSAVGYWVGGLEGATVLAAAMDSATAFDALFPAYEHLLRSAEGPHHMGPVAFTAYAVEAFARLGHLERAASCLLPLTNALADGTRFIWAHCLTARRAAIAAAAGGNWAEAEALFAAAYDEAEKYPRSILRADTELWQAWALSLRRQDGDLADTRALLDRAEPVMREHGLIGQLAFAEQIRARR